MKTAIIGAGAMGSLFAGLLSPHAQIRLLTGRTDHRDAIRSAGLILEEPAGERSVVVSVVSDPIEASGADLALVLCKSYQTEWAARTAARILAENGIALTLQNGLGNREILASVLGQARVWQGVTAQGATLIGPGRVRHAGTGPTYLETRPDLQDRVQEVVALFRQAGIETILSPHVEGLLWGKLVINAGINAVTAILRVPNGALLESPAAIEIMNRAVSEAAAVASAQGISLPYADPQARVRQVCRATSENRSSMLVDILRGGPTEIDFINGAIVREADRLGVPAPVNRMLAELVNAVRETSSHAAVSAQLLGLA